MVCVFLFFSYFSNQPRQSHCYVTYYKHLFLVHSVYYRPILNQRHRMQVVLHLHVSNALMHNIYYQWMSSNSSLLMLEQLCQDGSAFIGEIEWYCLGLLFVIMNYDSSFIVLNYSAAIFISEHTTGAVIHINKELWALVCLCLVIFKWKLSPSIYFYLL